VPREALNGTPQDSPAMELNAIDLSDPAPIRRWLAGRLDKLE